MQTDRRADDHAVEPNRRILIVDDNEAIHADFRKVLVGDAAPSDAFSIARAGLFGPVAAESREAPYELHSAYQGQEAVQRAKVAKEAGKPYAVAFVDVRMPPGWDGIETVERLWQFDPSVQIVLCTAYSDYSWDEMVSRLGRSDRLVILKKPFDNIEVRQLACALVEKWALARTADLKMADLERLVAERTAELRQEHERAVASELRYRLLAENSSDLISRHSADGVFLYASPASTWLLNDEPEALVGRAMREFIHGADQRQFDAFERQLRSGIAPEPASFRLAASGGEQR
jgi:PAS domain S-box-containing protein